MSKERIRKLTAERIGIRRDIQKACADLCRLYRADVASIAALKLQTQGYAVRTRAALASLEEGFARQVAGELAAGGLWDVLQERNLETMRTEMRENPLADRATAHAEAIHRLLGIAG